MKVDYCKSIEGDEYFLIIPETVFEEEFIGRFQDCKFETYVKTGLTVADIAGLKIKIINEKNN